MSLVLMRATMGFCELICVSRKRNLRQQPATNQPDGQITKNLSSPSRKNIPLFIRPKSAVISVPSRLDKRGGSRVVTNAGRDAVDAGSVRREACSQGGYP
jgi:hypothetical protein